MTALPRYRAVVLLLVVGALAAVGVGYISGGLAVWRGLLVAAALLFLWGLSEWQRWQPGISTAFALTFAVAAGGVAQRFPLLLMVAAALGALNAWLLGNTLRRYSDVPRVEGQSRMLQDLALRLFAIDTLSVALLFAVRRMQIRLRFLPALLLGVLLILALSYLIQAPRQPDEG